MMSPEATEITEENRIVVKILFGRKNEYVRDNMSKDIMNDK